VALDAVADAAVSGRRRLAQAGVAVTFTVRVATLSCAEGVAGTISGASPAAFVNAMQGAGLASCTTVAVGAPYIVPPQLLLTPFTVTATDASDIAASLASANASSAATQQQALMVSLSSANVASLCSFPGAAPESLSTEQAANTAAFVLAVVNFSASLPEAAQLAALDVLMLVATSAGVNSTTAQTITEASSAVASAALLGGNTAALARVQKVLAALTTSVAASLMAQQAVYPPETALPPAVTTSPFISTLVQLDATNSGDKFTTQLVGLNESVIQSFPPGLLPDNVTIVLVIIALSFDPHASEASATDIIAAGVTDVTRIEFVNAETWAVIPVTNATTPILFSLPAVNTSGDSQAVCAFWDTAASAYSTRGCQGMPNPRPPGHVLAFRPGFRAPNDAAIALAWDISGPMVCGDSCSVRLLDCNDADPGVVHPDPRNPLSVPAVACPPRVNGSTAAQPVLRVYTGTRCALWQANNAYNCSWDAQKQAFVGTGCVEAPGPTQCMCRHRASPRVACAAL
jgi:hypothetical protein